jgi:hypothetical protein
MRKIALIAALVLVALPGAALASQPTHPATPANSNANSHANGTSTTGTSSSASANAQTHAQSVKVLYVLHGTLGAYTAANGTTNGTIAITVKRSNHRSTLLENMTLTFPVSSTTNVSKTITSGHNGIVKVRAARNATAATLQTLTASQVIDLGASS